MLNTIKKVADNLKEKGLMKEAHYLYGLMGQITQQTESGEFDSLSLPELEAIHKAVQCVAESIDEKIKSKRLAARNW